MDQSNTQVFFVRHHSTPHQIDVPLQNDMVTGLSIKKAFCAKLGKTCNPNEFILVYAGQRLSDDKEYNLSLDLVSGITILNNPSNK